MAGGELWPDQAVGCGIQDIRLFEVRAQSAGTGPSQRRRTGQNRDEAGEASSNVSVDPEGAREVYVEGPFKVCVILVLVVFSTTRARAAHSERLSLALGAALQI